MSRGAAQSGPADPSRRAVLARGAALGAGAAMAGTLARPAWAGAGLVDALDVRRLVEVGRDGTRRVLEPEGVPRPFSAVGVRAPRDAHVLLRHRREDGRWSPWHPVPALVDEGPDAGTREARDAVAVPRAPVWAGPAGHSQLAVDRADPGALDVALIDTLGLGAGLGDTLGALTDRLWGQTDDPVEDRPAIRGRREWGAQPPREPPRYADGVDFAVIHHTVTANGYPREHTWGIARAIQHHHQHVNGWSDIGYNFLVDRFGRILQGRHGGAGQPVVGAHAGGFNTGAVGIALIGDHGATAVSDAAYEALVALLAWVCERHGIDPQGHTARTSGGSTRYPRGESVTLPTICGHRDVSHTACPGTLPYRRLASLRSDVARRVPGLAPPLLGG